MFADAWTYLQGHFDSYAMSILQHLKISAMAVLIAAAVGIPIGFAASKTKRAYHLSTGLFGMLRVIPSLAILVLFMPILGIGIGPSLVALTVLAVPPILTNTAIAFRSVPSAVTEAGLGMGMGKGHLFWRISVPLAMPLLLSGVRTAAVEVIASATLAAYVGSGGLGDLILTGLGLYRMDLLLLGGGTVALLSLLTDWVLQTVEKAVTGYQRA